MDNIRNFIIFSHIDHGKSTLADRFLELTETISKDKMRSQFLDMMDLEREKGITIKMQPVRMNYTKNNKSYILNLIDTPGHVDFNYEVSRSLAAVEGGILLVDATKGIQAQTLANLDLARKENLVIIAAVNKIDLAHASTEETKEEMAQVLHIAKENVMTISGKTGANTENLLQEVIDKVPFPKGSQEKPLKALVFDSNYDSYKGVITYVRVFDGKVKTGDKIFLMQAKQEAQVREVGYFSPSFKPCLEIKAGEIGYIATGIKESSLVAMGETITKTETKNIVPLSGYNKPKPMVFASVFPENDNDFDTLKEALAKLKLNDAALDFELETKELLGRGFKCGFLGSLHAEIVWERLKREYGLDLVISTPSVVYRIIDKKNKERTILSVNDWPDPSDINETKEPWVKLEIITPVSYLGQAMELLEKTGGKYVETKYLTQKRLILTYEVPLRKIIAGFFDKLKGATQGFASMNYEFLGYQKADLIKLDVLIAGKKEDVFSRIIDKKEAFDEAKRIVAKLKDILPSQLFALPVQAAISSRIIARATIQAKRRDVIAPLYGGDYTRKRKLLEQQKKGKKKLKARGQVHIPPQVFLEMFKS